MTELPRILVVDDEEDIRDSVQEWLLDAGYEVETASDGREALKRLSARSFQVVITDLRMPHCDGLELLDSIKTSQPDVPVIFLSGQATVADAIAALRGGRSFDFIEKPLHDGRRLCRIIERALAQGASPRTEPADAQAPEEGHAIAHPIVREALDFVRTHLAEHLTLAQVAHKVGYTPAYLTELVRVETGETLSRWITRLRFEKAKHLLGDPHAPISQVATLVGFSDPSHFIRRFRQFEGQTPMAWRDASRQPD